MRIKNITIENFRSVKKENIGLDGFNILVGQNNHGKTNVLEAIEWFYDAKKSANEDHYGCDTSNVITIEITFINVQKGVQGMKTELHKTKMENLLGSADELVFRKSSTDFKKIMILNGQELKNPTGIDAALNEFLPKKEYVHTRVFLEDVSCYKSTTPIGQMLSGVLTTIIENDQQYDNFKKQFDKLFAGDDSSVRKELDKLGKQVEGYLLKQFPEGTKVIFSVDDPQLEDLLKRFKTEVDDGIKTDANQKGDGMQRAIMLAIIQAYADFRKLHGDGKTFLFLIDEAELHLHPSAQRALKKALLDIVEQGDQVIINTHSSVLVVDDAEGQRVLKVEKENGQTHVTSADKTDLQGIIYELLGGSPSDLLFPKNFIIVEGKSDFEFMKNVIKRFYESEYGDIQILFAGGDIDAQEESMLSVHRLFVPIATSRNPIYKEKVVIICDKPNVTQETKYRQFRDGYPYIQDNEQLFVIPENSIEQYYPSAWKKTEEEVRQMQTEQTKVSYAKQVASAISKETFESEMSIIFKALKKAKERSF